MCAPTTCSRCGKTTWRGCGQHIETVMANVPPANRCQCERTQPKSLLRRIFPR